LVVEMIRSQTLHPLHTPLLVLFSVGRRI
jgi:hypothetical protein